MKRLAICSLCAAALLQAGCSSVTGRLLTDDPLVRSEAIEAVAKSGEKAKNKTVARLKKILKKKNSPDRARAAAALEDLGPAAAGAIPELIAALNDADTDVADSADRALKRLDAATPALAAALVTKDPALRSKVSQALIYKGAAAVPALIKNFEKGKKELALWSAAVLGQMGPAAESAIPALARAAISNDPAVAGQASAALSAVGAPAGLWLAAALRSANSSSRAGASKVLSSMTPPPPEAAEALISALEDPDEKVRGQAAMALASYPPAAYSSLPKNLGAALEKAAGGTDAAAGWAKTALAKAAPAAPAPKADDTAALSAALKSPDPEARIAAAAALGAMGPAAFEAVPELWIAFKSKDCRQRFAAAGALIKINPRLKKYGALSRALNKVCPGKKAGRRNLPGPAAPAPGKPANGQPPSHP